MGYTRANLNTKQLANKGNLKTKRLLYNCIFSAVGARDAAAYHRKFYLGKID